MQQASSPTSFFCNCSKMHRLELLVVAISCALHAVSAQIRPFCGNDYELRAPANEYCYRYYQTAEDFSAANRSCVRDGANLLSIDSEEENTYIYDTFFQPNGNAEFWIGLNDITDEGVFRWVNRNTSQVSYVNWAEGSASNSGNSRRFDCVKFSSDGWRVHDGFCTTASLPHICKAPSCMSLDGVNCIGSEPTTSSPGVAVEVIVIPVVLVIFLVLLIVLVLVLVALWKFNNDMFQRYCCCCCAGGSKSATVHNMQQENQRLRHELSQHKISMSGRYQPGQLGGGENLSGVPDGKGGLLPAIKRPLPATRLSPTTEESRMLGLANTSTGDQIPPPLVPQRPSLISPMSRQTSQTSFFFGNPAVTPGRPIRQSLPGSFVMPSRPNVPAPVRGGPGTRVARQSLISATKEGDGKEDSGSESSKSQTEDKTS